jgi:hypothetical protein
MTVPAAAAQPFVVFAADAAWTDPSVTPLAAKYLLPTDYLGLDAVTHVPSLSTVVNGNHTVLLDTSLAALQTDRKHGANTILYYQGDLSSTRDIEAAAKAIHSQPGARFGIMPGGEFFGYQGPCRFDTNSGAWRTLDWSQIDYVSITASSLLNDRCAGKTGPENYASLAATVAAFVRQKNPLIVVTAQLSFRDTAPDTLVAAAKAMTGLVDGFFFSYPLNHAMDHRYSNAQSLETVLSALRPARP